MLERITISFFGRTNVGKSSLINAICAQNVSIVSEIPGTTTDPVKKVMELLPIGPVTLIDTPGLDDESELGKLRIEKTEKILNSTQIAILVIDSKIITDTEEKILKEFSERKLPHLIVVNKCDDKNTCDAKKETFPQLKDEKIIFVSAKNAFNINLLKEEIGKLYQSISAEKAKKYLVSDLIPAGSTVILVIPIDEAAPKDRLILPQQMTIRDLLESGSIPLCTTPENLLSAIKKLSSPPALVITDSQAFKKVNQLLPESIPLTSFSILMARYKGTLKDSLEGACKLDSLKDNDKILISEGCTHHRQCGDIGSVKLPAWIRSYSEKEVLFDFSSASTFPDDLSPYSLIIHCGGCMLNENEMQNRSKKAKEQKIPFTNYGMTIAKMTGILEKSLKPLKLK